MACQPRCARPGHPDNSAIFLGISRLAADIDRVEFSGTGAPNVDFSINRVDLCAGLAPMAYVGDPTSIALLPVSLTGFAGTRRRWQAA